MFVAMIKERVMETVWIAIKENMSGHLEWIKDYMREISVIILGLCITYYGDSLVDAYKEREEDKEAIKMVRDELLSNIRELNDMQDYYRMDIRLSDSFKASVAAGLDNVKEDSIGLFKNHHRLYHYWTLKDHAFRMVRESATMQRLDKSLLTGLFECYEYIDVVEKMGESYREKRFNELLLFFNEVSADGQGEGSVLEQWRRIDADVRFRNYIMTVMPMLSKSSLAVCGYAEGMVLETKEAIEKAYPDISDAPKMP